MKQIRIVLVLVLAAGFLLVTSRALASPALQGNSTHVPNTPGAQATDNANEIDSNQPGKSQKGKHQHFKGMVSAVDSSSITLTLRDGSSVTVGLSADTRLKFPGPKNSAPASLQTGMNVMVQAIRDQSDHLVARMVMVIPGKPTRIHRVGIVTAYTAGQSITIQARDGASYTFALNAEIKLLPPERADMLTIGSRVTIIAPRDPASGGVTVLGIVIHPDTP